MPIDGHTERSRTQSQTHPEVVDPEEYDPITLVFYDARVADTDAFDMPDPTE